MLIVATVTCVWEAWLLYKCQGIHGCVSVSQGKWEIRGVGRGAHGDRERARVRWAVTPRTMPTAAVNAASLLLRGRNFVLCTAEQGTICTFLYADRGIKPPQI